MDFNFFVSAIDGYKIEDLLDFDIPYISDPLRKHYDTDKDFLFDLILFAFDEKFMKRSYEGKYLDINQSILDNKDSIMQKLKLNYPKLKSLMARDFSLCSTFKLFSEYKQIYSVDKSFMRDLVFTQSSSNSIPRDIFDHLPYNSFYLEIGRAHV